jgi:type I restriction enzyme, S subunit
LKITKKEHRLSINDGSELVESKMNSDRVTNNELPHEWNLVNIRQVAEINQKIDKSLISDDLTVSFVPMPAVAAENGLIDVSQKKPFSEVKKGYTGFLEGDVLFAKITPCMENGKMAVVPKLINGFGFGSTEFHVLRPKTVNAKYLYFFVSSKNFRKNAIHQMTGAVGQKRVPAAYLKECKIPLAPLNEQTRIVAEIEKQFSRLDEAVENLKRVKANLKRYKAAVLKAAVEGRLTEEWRKTHPDVEPAARLLGRILAERRKKWEEAELAAMNARGKVPKDNQWKKKYKEPPQIDINLMPDLPAGWTWVSLPQIGELNRGKSKHRPRNAPFLYGGPYPFVQTGDVKHATGTIKHYTQTYSEKGLKQSRLWPKGTLCITIAANIADTAILGFDACFPDSIVGFIPDAECIEVKFIEYFLRTAKENLERYAPATAQKNINLAILNDVAVPLPPENEQKLIVNEIEKNLSVAERIEISLDQNLARADRLRQSILKKAFSGRLAPRENTEESDPALSVARGI